MYNWSVDTKKLRKNPKKYAIWKLEQMINFGLDGEKLDKEEIKRFWPKIKDRLDPDKRKVMEFFLWQKPWKKEKGLNPDRSNFWSWFLKTHT